jgi:peptidoglycan hydrolase-like protein with peptidoglycan-binding domain
MSDIDRAGLFNTALHPHGAGGKFATTGGAGKTAPAKPGGQPAGKPAPVRHPKGSLAFDGRTGPGYGKPHGDRRVHRLQHALNRLGMRDAQGNKLVLDGKLGPRTTAAIRSLQRALGLRPDGVVTPELLRHLGRARSIAGLKKTLTPKVHHPRVRHPRQPHPHHPRPAKAPTQVVHVGG